jgi:hypothetical protein
MPHENTNVYKKKQNTRLRVFAGCGFHQTSYFPQRRHSKFVFLYVLNQAPPLLSVPPEPPVILSPKGKVVAGHDLGPFEVGADLEVTCQVAGGKIQ